MALHDGMNRTDAHHDDANPERDVTVYVGLSRAEPEATDSTFQVFEVNPPYADCDQKAESSSSDCFRLPFLVGKAASHCNNGLTQDDNRKETEAFRNMRGTNMTQGLFLEPDVPWNRKFDHQT